MCDENSTNGALNERFNTPTRFGVLLVCEGAPESTSLWNVWCFLSRKLMNPRFYDFLPRWLWRPLVYTVVLPCIVRQHQRMHRGTWILSRSRSNAPAENEDAVTTTETAAAVAASAGSEVVGTATVVALAEQLGRLVEQWLRQKLMGRRDASVQVEVGFYHRRGSVEAALERLQLRGGYGRDARDSAGMPVAVEVEELMVLPLYPHHKAEFTGTVWDAVMRSSYFQRHENIPNVHFIRNYADHEVYLDTWNRHIRRYVGQHGTPDWLFIVFQGTRKYVAASGDTYRDEYTSTAEQLRERLSTSWSTSSSMPTPADGQFFRGSLNPSRIKSAFLGHGSEALREPRLERVFLSIIRQLKSISAMNSLASSLSSSAVNRRGSSDGAASDAGGLSAFLQSRTPLPLDMAPTAFVVCPGEALDSTTTLWRLQKVLFPEVKKLGWRDIQYIPALNDTAEHAEVLSAVLEPYLL
ncbi:ferrochelatase [Leptomonas pyrrhocoris]|uniref:Ferrochelatase n=1 Tax=Leptomonas pyrrhocoris TaxID=157538 RepID=A0A0N0DWA8_LEPPY|nr:ferrochelatase [Leptomonas pyrrhocoris]KPA81562.1 ferrochelatase [Leptomonas pyrrhocoris]|eukprot:XP_015660001.1 ferrochelatase [Leptomonas pyrrhocoris]